MEIKIDLENCLSCGSCEVMAPNTFKLNAEGKSEVINEKGDSDEKILEAAKSCPVGAIILTDEDGKRIWPEN
jgi:ferredoxin